MFEIVDGFLMFLVTFDFVRATCMDRTQMDIWGLNTTEQIMKIRKITNTVWCLFIKIFGFFLVFAYLYLLFLYRKPHSKRLS